MTDQSNEPDRLFQRRKVIKGGTIAFNRRRLTYPCVVRDISEAGARMRVDTPDSIPETFDLLIELDGFEAECEVLWREGREIGVRFLSEPRISNPKRKQVVVASDPSRIVSVRLDERKRQFNPTPKAHDGERKTEPSQADDVELQQADPVADAPVEPKREARLLRHAEAGPDASEPIVEPEGAGAGDTESPTQDSTQAEQSETAPPAPVDHGVRPILIVEQDDAVRHAMRLAFRSLADRVPLDFSDTGADLLERLSNREPFDGLPRPGMIVFDLDADIRQDRPILNQLRSHPAFSTAPVVALTLTDADADLEETYGLGISLYLDKPECDTDFAKLAKTLARFWTSFVATPRSGRAASHAGVA
ncbi:MAG: PilZ domain-containing protein [Pseudomonadota bacterium]